MAEHPLAELSELVREIRHLEGERARQPDDGRWRRRQGARLAELVDRFELVVERWVPEAEDREAWRRAVHQGGAPPPLELPDEPPPLYVGRSDDGVRIDVRPSRDGRLVVRMGEDVLLRDPTGFPEAPGALEIAGRAYPEIVEVSTEALEALRRWVETAREGPPWPWARTLYADGLVDEHLSLTPRGHRVLEAG